MTQIISNLCVTSLVRNDRVDHAQAWQHGSTLLIFQVYRQYIPFLFDSLALSHTQYHTCSTARPRTLLEFEPFPFCTLYYQPLRPLKAQSQGFCIKSSSSDSLLYYDIHLVLILRINDVKGIYYTLAGLEES